MVNPECLSNDLVIQDNYFPNTNIDAKSQSNDSLSKVQSLSKSLIVSEISNQSSVQEYSDTSHLDVEAPTKSVLQTRSLLSELLELLSPKKKSTARVLTSAKPFHY